MPHALHKPVIRSARFQLDSHLWAALKVRLQLTPRQADILELTLRGYSVKQIAGELGVKLPTVRTHLSRLFERLDVRDRGEAILVVFTEAQSLWRGGLSFTEMTSA